MRQIVINNTYINCSEIVCMVDYISPGQPLDVKFFMHLSEGTTVFLKASSRRDMQNIKQIISHHCTRIFCFNPILKVHGLKVLSVINKHDQRMYKGRLLSSYAGETQS